ncbi:MAG: glycosyltransferase family 2 protein [Dehalococcoidia bacterium]|nr:glycosyltransferase family 2 protein [Dehalococcoidia bacterium]
MATGNGVEETPVVLVCTPVYRKGAYVIDKFLTNQREIQQRYPASELILATIEDDFIGELERLLGIYELRGRVISYKTVKPYSARSRIWNTKCGREEMRRYMLAQTEARYMLCLDADMTYDPDVIQILLKEIDGCSLAHSGCALRDFGIGLSGTACTLLTRDVLEKLEFRCYEFKNSHVIPEDLMLEVDLFRLRCKTRRGFFLSSCHYRNDSEARCISPQPVGMLRRISNAPFVRYILIRASIIMRYNITLKLKFIYNRLIGATDIEDPFQSSIESN